jgi:hypothetical protein
MCTSQYSCQFPTMIACLWALENYRGGPLGWKGIMCLLEKLGISCGLCMYPWHCAIEGILVPVWLCHFSCGVWQ